MAIYQVLPTELKALADTSFGAEGIIERKDIQRLLREQISVLDERLMVVAEEFGDWLDRAPGGSTCCALTPTRTSSWSS